MFLSRVGIFVFLLLGVLLAPARAALRADQAAFLSEVNAQYSISEWVDAPSCSWTGVSCCLAGDYDCDPTDDLITSLDLTSRGLVGNWNISLDALVSPLSASMYLSDNDLTGFDALNNLYAPTVSVYINNHKIVNFIMENAAIDKLEALSSTMTSVWIRNSSFTSSLKICGENVVTLHLEDLYGMTDTTRMNCGSDVPVWLALRNVSFIGLEPNPNEWYTPEVGVYADHLENVLFERVSLDCRIVTNSAQNVLIQNVNSAITIYFKSPSYVPDPVVGNFIVLDSVLTSINAEARSLQNFTMLNSETTDTSYMFETVKEVKNVYVVNCLVRLPEWAEFAGSLFWQRDFSVPKFGKIYIENWHIDRARFGSINNIKVYNTQPFRYLNISDCHTCDDWLPATLAIQSDISSRLAAINCSINSTEWIHSRPMWFAIDLSYNNIEIFDEKITTDMYFWELNLVGNPLKRFKLVADRMRYRSEPDFDVFKLYTSGATEHFEVQNLTISSDPTMWLGRTGPRPSLLNRIPADFENHFIVKNTMLRVLDISGHGIEGSFPLRLLKWNPLTYFDISHNKFNGTVPAEMYWPMYNPDPDLMLDADDPARITLLEELRLSYNDFEGTIPDAPYGINVFRVGHNRFVGPHPVPLIREQPPYFWDLQGNYFSGDLQLPAALPRGSLIDVSDNLLNCPSDDVQSLGITGDFTRNLCVGAGTLSEYPTDTLQAACTTVFPFTAAPCRPFNLAPCRTGCRRSWSAGLDVTLTGQLPGLKSLYTEFSLQAGGEVFDCLNEMDTRISFTMSSTSASCAILPNSATTGALGRVYATVNIASVAIYNNSWTGYTLVPSATVEQSNCTRNCKIAAATSSLTATINGTGLPQFSDDVQSFIIRTAGSSKRSSAGMLVDCKALGSLSFSNGTGLSCTMPAGSVPVAPGEQLLVSLTAYGYVVVTDLATGLSTVPSATPAVVSTCSSNCVRRTASAPLKVTIFGGNLPTSANDIDLFTVMIGSGVAPSGAVFSCITGAQGITFSGQTTSLTCEIASSMQAETLSGPVSVSLVVWGNQVLLQDEPTGDVVTAGSSDIAGTNVGVAVGVSVAVIVVVIVVVIVIIVVVLRRRLNNIMSVEMQELKSNLSEDQIKGVLNIKASDISLVKKLGEGAFGTVWLANYNNKLVAVKKLSGSALSGQLAEFFREASLMLSIPPHKNIVTVYGMCQDVAALSLVMELVSNGSLDAHLKRVYFPGGEKMTSLQLHNLLLGIAQGMEHLVKNGIVHRDLATRNVLINADLTPKISDFGMSRIVSDSSKEGQTAQQIGPIRWMSPEAFDRFYSEKSDVWAYGVVIWECLTGKLPFEDMDQMKVALKVRDEGFTLEYAIPPNTPDYLKELMKWCWGQKPTDRPTFSQIVKFLDGNAPEGAVTSDSSMAVGSTTKGPSKRNIKEKASKRKNVAQDASSSSDEKEKQKSPDTPADTPKRYGSAWTKVTAPIGNPTNVVEVNEGQTSPDDHGYSTLPS